jgi:pimeloyl-ACP methyl ester carboxylesterase
MSRRLPFRPLLVLDVVVQRAFLQCRHVYDDVASVRSVVANGYPLAERQRELDLGNAEVGHDGRMAMFRSYDGTQIGYRVLGAGPPLVCLPGGPGRASEYLGDLGGLSQSRRLIMPDTRGTGESADASDPLSYRCDRLVGDVEALRAHLGLDRMDLLGHSAAGNLAVLYAAAHPQRVAHLILLTPGLRAVGIEEDDEHWRAALARRSAEPWYPDALAAAEKAEAGDESAENRRAYMPFFYGRWDTAAQAHVDVGVSERSRPVRGSFGAAGAFNPAATREEAGRLAAPVLVYAGELDANPTPATAAAGAALFPNATVIVQPGAAHFPWLDDPAFFTAAITSFLS